MMKKIVFAFCLLLSAAVSGQSLVNIDLMEAPKDLQNVHVEKIHSDSLSSEFVIWIKHKVKPHYHEFHSETIYILEGEGKMRIGDVVHQVKKGDFFNIPMKSIHAVEVTSDIPMKVLSIQTPEFLGKDRVFIE